MHTRSTMLAYPVASPLSAASACIHPPRLCYRRPYRGSIPNGVSGGWVSRSPRPVLPPEICLVARRAGLSSSHVAAIAVSAVAGFLAAAAGLAVCMSVCLSAAVMPAVMPRRAAWPPGDPSGISPGWLQPGLRPGHGISPGGNVTGVSQIRRSPGRVRHHCAGVLASCCCRAGGIAPGSVVRGRAG
jgi:hypothetical protein